MPEFAPATWARTLHSSAYGRALVGAGTVLSEADVQAAAVLAVLPAGCLVFPVGGIEPGNMASLRSAGAAGFGIGSSLFKPGQSPDIVSASAARFVKAWRASTT